MKKFSISIAKKLGYVSAVLVIIAAILVAFSRVYIPALDRHRADFERWAGEILDAPVTIEKARFSWYQYQPEISLYNLTLYDKKTKKPSFHLKRLHVFLSIPKSIWERKIVLSGIMLSGAEINVEQTASGEFVAKELSQLKEINGKQLDTQETKVAEMMAWLMSQPRISLSDIDLYYTAFNGQKRFVTFSNLRFENGGDHHVVLARVILHQDIPTEVSLVVRGNGDVSQPEAMKVNAYVYFSGLSLSQWVSNAEWRGWEVKDGLGSAKIWLTWDKGAVQQVQSIFQVYELQLASTKTKALRTINRLSADVGWKRDGDQQIVAADDVLLDMQDHIWPVTNMYVALKPDKTKALMPTNIRIGYFNVTDVLAFLDNLPDVIPADIKATIDHLKPSGGISRVNVTMPENITDWTQAALQATFSGLNLQAWERYPGVKHLTGSLELDKQHGKLLIDSKNVEINYQSLFELPLQFGQLAADVTLDVTGDEWVAKAASIKAINTDINIEANGYIKQSGKLSPYIDLQAAFQVDNIRNIAGYLPQKVFEPGLNAWLKDAFIQGYAQHGSAVIQGSLSDFPFADGNGKFNISTDVKDVSLKYARGWPLLDSINANVEFAGSTVTVNVSDAKTMGINTGTLGATIDNLGNDDPTQLHVNVKEISTDFATALKYVRHSPLNKTVGKMFKDMEVKGPITLVLGLALPLADPDKTTVDGTINLSNVNIMLVPWRLQIAKVNGQAHFTENTTDADLLKGELFNKPIAISLQMINKRKDTAILQATTTSNVAIQDLEKWLNVPFSKVITGATDVKANIDLALDKPVEIHLSSDLSGAEVRLPAPYAKSAADKVNFTADISLPENKPLRLQMDYGEKLNAALTLTSMRGAFQLVGVDLRLGEGKAGWPEGRGLYITGHIPLLNLEKIKSYATQSSEPLVPGLDLMGIDVTVKSVDIFGQDLDDVRLQIKPVQSGWNIVIIDDDISGQIDLPAKMSSSGKIKARFDKFDLDIDKNKSASLGDVDIKSLPEVDFSAADASINEMMLGQVSFDLVPATKGMSIRSLRIQSPSINLNAEGSWTANQGSSDTQLQGVLETKNVSALLNDLDFKLKNFIATKGTLKFDLSWPDAPFTPQLKYLHGEAVLDMGSGRIVDVGEENDAKMDLGRMLSIFSLQSIPRRLSLDFSDLVEKGYSFDSLRGNFRLSNGSVYTNNSKFEAPVAGVAIKGRIGVVAKDVDIILSVTPHVASSLPIAATIIGGPVAGIASLAVGSVVNAAVSTVATHEYIVKGSWDHPEWSTPEPEQPKPASRRNR